MQLFFFLNTMNHFYWGYSIIHSIVQDVWGFKGDWINPAPFILAPIIFKFDKRQQIPLQAMRIMIFLLLKPSTYYLECMIPVGKLYSYPWHVHTHIFCKCWHCQIILLWQLMSSPLIICKQLPQCYVYC